MSEKTIDEAWAEAEAALGEYWRVRSLIEVGPKWEAVATDGHRITSGVGATPAAALRDLIRFVARNDSLSRSSGTSPR